MASKRPRDPLIAIIGTTGTGKSNLAVDLAVEFNGEVINADAMQMYAGLPIITNKIPLEERKGIPHHLLGCIGLDEPTWTVEKFVSAALETIAQIRSRGRLPILVGGTHYYTQALLLNARLASNELNSHDDAPAESKTGEHASDSALLQGPTEQMLAKLREVDPVMAARWHPNDRRKIRRSLEIWFQTGRKASDIYAAQQGIDSATPENPQNTYSEPLDPMIKPEVGLRFPTLMLWTHTPRDQLVERLDSRVHNMYASGLLAEAQELYDLATRIQATGKPIDTTRGIYVSIGYKEFLPLLQLPSHPSDISMDTASRARLENECIEATQAATRRYAKYQLRWLRIKLAHALHETDAHRSVYVLDTMDTAQWDVRVRDPATRYTRGFLQGEELPDTYAVSAAVQETLQPLREYDLSRRRELWQTRVCEPCGVTAVTENDWFAHIGSNRHAKRLAKERKAIKQLSEDAA